MKSSDYNKEQYSLGLLIQQVSKTNLPAIHERNIICTRSGINQAKQYFSRILYISTKDYKCYKQWNVIVHGERKLPFTNYNASILSK